MGVQCLTVASDRESNVNAFGASLLTFLTLPAFSSRHLGQWHTWIALYFGEAKTGLQLRDSP
ncbi:hypothetical protein GCM10027454_19720 [Algoriphagus aestuariicola]